MCELGDQMGVVAECELWGTSKALSKLSQAAFVAIESGHPKACVLADVYHLHKGGSGFTGVGLLSGAALQVFHVNDYPAMPGRDTITDADRVYPGDGVAPLVAAPQRLDTFSPVVAFQSHTFESAAAEANRLPSGLYATL